MSLWSLGKIIRQVMPLRFNWGILLFTLSSLLKWQCSYSTEQYAPPELFGTFDNIFGATPFPFNEEFEIKEIDISDNEVEKKELDRLEKVTSLAEYIKQNYKLCSIIKLPEKIINHGSKIVYINKKPQGMTLSSIIHQFLTQSASYELYSSMQRVFTRIAETLAYVHENGDLKDTDLESRLIHSELTPDNIWYSLEAAVPVVMQNNWKFSVDKRRSIFLDLSLIISNCQELLNKFEDEQNHNNFMNNFAEAYIEAISAGGETKDFLKNFFKDFIAVRPEFFRQKSMEQAAKDLSEMAKAEANGENPPPEKIRFEGLSKLEEHDKIVVKRQLEVVDTYMESILLYNKHKKPSLMNILETVKMRRSPLPKQLQSHCFPPSCSMPPIEDNLLSSSSLAKLIAGGSSSSKSSVKQTKRGRPPISKQKGSSSAITDLDSTQPSHSSTTYGNDNYCCTDTKNE